jgi:hypothetical protein
LDYGESEMLTISAPLSTLTTFIDRDSECLHLASDIEFPHPSGKIIATAALCILPGASQTTIAERIAAVTGLSAGLLESNLSGIRADRSYFHLCHQSHLRVQATLHLPHHHYLRLQSSIHRISAGNTLSFRVPLASDQATLGPLAPTALPHPLAVLFMLENKISLHALPRLEIAISSLPTHAALAHNFPPLECQGA